MKIVGHNSGFEAIWTKLEAPSILLNGVGNVTRYNNSNQNTAEVPEPYTVTVDPPAENSSPGIKKIKRYLLRLINTSFESTFIFSIDKHNLTVVEADFVPIKPYTTTSVLVGIGQRYHVILEASNPDGGHKDYWMRTWRAHCFLFPGNKSANYEQTGILSYKPPKGIQNELVDSPWEIDFNCSDEDATKLQPVVSWPKITYPANDPHGHVGENLTVIFQKTPSLFPLALASMGGDTFNPFSINYGDPTFLHLNYTGAWPPLWVVYPENFTDDSFVSALFLRKGKTTTRVR